MGKATKWFVLQRVHGRIAKESRIIKRGEVRHSLDAAALEYRGHLTSQFARGTLRPKQFIEQCWFSTRAGARGVEDLAADPESSQRNEGRIVNRCLGINWIIDNFLVRAYWPQYSYRKKKSFAKRSCGFFLHLRYSHGDGGNDATNSWHMWTSLIWHARIPIHMH